MKLTIDESEIEMLEQMDKLLSQDDYKKSDYTILAEMFGAKMLGQYRALRMTKEKMKVVG